MMAYRLTDDISNVARHLRVASHIYMNIYSNANGYWTKAIKDCVSRL